MSEQKPPHIVILGAGFAGATLARELLEQPVQITLIDNRNYSLFQPLLYQVATGALQSEAIAMPLRRWIKGSNVHHVWGKVVEIDLNHRQVALKDGRSMTYDTLCIALGTHTNFFGNTEIERNALHVKTIEQAEHVRSHIFAELERATACTDAAERAAHLTFTIAGGGPTGVEFATSLLQTLRTLVPREYPELSLDEIKLTVIQGGDALLPGFATTLQRAAEKKLGQLGAELRLNTHVSGFNGCSVRCDNGPEIKTHTLVWTAGVTAPELIAELPVPKGHGNRLLVDEQLRLPDYKDVFVLGDLAQSNRDDVRWPQVAPFALQTAQHVANVIRQTINGTQEQLKPFKYKDPGSMVVLGHYDAVCQIDRWRLHWHGLSAWILWVGLHVYRIIGLRNRLLLLIDWGTDYLRTGNAVELIRHRDPASIDRHDGARETDAKALK